MRRMTQRLYKSLCGGLKCLKAHGKDTLDLIWICERGHLMTSRPTRNWHSGSFRVTAQVTFGLGNEFLRLKAAGTVFMRRHISPCFQPHDYHVVVVVKTLPLTGVQEPPYAMSSEIAHSGRSKPSRSRISGRRYQRRDMITDSDAPLAGRALISFSEILA